MLSKSQARAFFLGGTIVTFGAFLGFVVGTVSKLVVAGMLIYYYIITII